jgi:phage portal protein BeeE
MEDHGAITFRNGARVSGVLKHPNKLGPEAVANLKAELKKSAPVASRVAKTSSSKRSWIMPASP